MNLLPTLEVRLEGKGKGLFASFGVAVLCCGILCGGLALVIAGRQLFPEDFSEASEPLSVSNRITRKEQPVADPTPAPLNVISAVYSPFKITYTPPTPLPSSAKETPLPTSTVDAVVLNNLEIEELDFENPFVEKKPEGKKITRDNEGSVKTVTRKDSSPTIKPTTASLAKKIAREAYPTSRSTPNYPRSARKEGLEGRVVVTVTIGTSGKVTDSYVSKSCGHPALDGSALSAAKRFRFSPAINGLGHAVPVKRAIPFNFQITG